MGKEVKTMYEGLVKRLRNCATEDNRCNVCSLVTDAFCYETLMTQAADAIEELEYKYKKALSDLVKRAEPSKEETC